MTEMLGGKGINSPEICYHLNTRGGNQSAATAKQLVVMLVLVVGVRLNRW